MPRSTYRKSSMTCSSISPCDFQLNLTDDEKAQLQVLLDETVAEPGKAFVIPPKLVHAIMAHQSFDLTEQLKEIRSRERMFSRGISVGYRPSFGLIDT